MKTIIAGVASSTSKIVPSISSPANKNHQVLRTNAKPARLSHQVQPSSTQKTLKRNSLKKNAGTNSSKLLDKRAQSSNDLNKNETIPIKTTTSMTPMSFELDKSQNKSLGTVDQHTSSKVATEQRRNRSMRK